MSSITQSVDSLLTSTAPYSVSSGLMYNTEGIMSGFGEATYSGDMSGDIWKETNKMGKDQFLNLLMTQLRYQDPLDPMDNTQFVSQLAQFSSLESSQNTEKAIRELGSAFQLNLDAQMYSAQSVANSSAMSLIGKEVRMRQITISYDGRAGAQIPIRAHLGNTDSGTIEIRDAEKNVIRTLTVSGKDAENSATAYWDGKSDDGTYAKPGNYAISIKGSDTNSALYTFVQAVVEGVRFTSDGVLVKIDGREISIGEVLDVSVGENGDGYISQSSALSLMGKNVRWRNDSIQHSATEGAEYSILINAPAHQQVSVEIKDNGGNVVTTLHGYPNEFGQVQLFWDGYSAGGKMASAGDYTINVVGANKNSNMYSYAEGTVDGLTSLTGNFKLKVGGDEIAISDIIEISAPKATAP